MTTTALDTSAAHPLYLYVVFVGCVVAAIVLLIGASLSRRRSSWRRQAQLQAPATRTAVPAYPTEPAPEPALSTADADDELVTASTAKAPARKSAAKKTTTAKKTAAKKTTTAKKATAKKTPRSRT